MELNYNSMHRQAYLAITPCWQVAKRKQPRKGFSPFLKEDDQGSYLFVCVSDEILLLIICCSIKQRMSCSWFCIGLGWLPILVGIFMGMSIFIPYAISVSLGHVSAGFPYISDTGTYVPESCIFGQLLNITAALAFATMYVRYKQVDETTRDTGIAPGGRWNRLSLVLGCCAALGMSLVANFQELNVLTVHLIGATGCFGLGTVYCFIQTLVSYRIHPHFCTQTTYRVRGVLSVISLLAFICTMLFASLANSQWVGDFDDKTKWPKDQPGYTEHVVSTASEWILAFAFLAYFFTFIREFQKIELEAQLKPSTYFLLLGSSPSGEYS